MEKTSYFDRGVISQFIGAVCQCVRSFISRNLFAPGFVRSSVALRLRLIAPNYLLIALLPAFASAGCVGATMSASTYAVKAGPRNELQPLAEGGDSAAQYELGKSYCCMGPGFDTQTATKWLCKAAHQGNADAMYELGRIYQGDVSRTMAPGQKLMQAMKAKESRPHAELWLSLAASANHPDARKRLAEITKRISENEGAIATRLKAAWRNAPCEYERVFPTE